jgi:uncharacterized 2Fe-2S/4Fe-4S cluster protein (DUF4445 family)
MHKVTFLPEGKQIEVNEGSTILESAQASGVSINSACGGNGVCGKCRVRITDGKIRADARAMSFLSREEIKAGFVLACQTKVDADMEIIIPIESIPKEPQILLEGIQVQYSSPEKIQLHKVPTDPANLFDPLIQSIYLEMETPSPNDNVSDLDRLIRELRKKTGYGSFEICLNCLRSLAMDLRENEWKVTATIARYANVWQVLQIKGGDAARDSYGAAVDVGTTTVVVQLINMKSGNVIGVAGNSNLQSRYGEDVISRMIYACGRDEHGLSHLNSAVVENINELIVSLASEKGINHNDIHALVAAGNTTMSHLFLNLKPCTIRLAPYVPTATVYPRVAASDLNIQINPDGLIVVVPSVSSYVGGDIVAGVLATGIADRPETRVLIDVGTNGEIALGNSEWLVCCSASAGPAFEGGGIRYGMRATRGAIEKVVIENGAVHYKTISSTRPRGVCGSGLIDCLYEFSRNHIIAGDGAFRIEAGNGRIIEKDGETVFILAYAEETESGQDLVITQSDINHLVQSKGAIFAAIKSLLDYVGLKFEDIATFYVAGGFGSSLDIQKSIGIGLLPDIAPERIQFVGNSSLMGARMCLLSAHVARRAAQIARMMTSIELSNYPPFMNEYVAAMFLPHTDRKLFPSVGY